MQKFIGLQPNSNCSYNVKNNLYEIFTTYQALIGPKIKNAQNLLKFGLIDFNFKINSYEIFTTCQAQISPKIKNAQNLLKFGTFDISNMPVSILMSKITFMKYLPPAKPNQFQN